MKDPKITRPVGVNVFAACEKIVDIEIPSEDPRLVIESEIYNIKDKELSQVEEVILHKEC